MWNEIAKRLAEKGAQVFAFDPSEERIESIKEDVAFAVALDATDKKALQSQKINDMDAVVVAIGENFEATILTCVHLMDLGVSRIIARASGEHQKLILEKIGVPEILTPEDEVVFVVREKLINRLWLSMNFNAVGLFLKAVGFHFLSILFTHFGDSYSNEYLTCAV